MQQVDIKFSLVLMRLKTREDLLQ